MVLIISDGIDTTTHEVIDWLIHQNEKYYVINTQQNVSSVYIELLGVSPKITLSFKGSGKSIAISNVTSFWYRKGDLNFDFNKFLPKEVNNLKLNLIHHLHDEWQTLKEFIFSILEERKTLGNYTPKYKGKLETLMIARKCGLLIPNTFIFNNTNQLKKIKKKCPEMITKTIQDIFNSVIDKNSIFTYTSLLSEEQSLKMPSSFFPSLAQTKIEKKYELRIFFIGNELYPMAIFSQNDEMTKLDFRNYNKRVPNRTVPYKLPIEIEKNILVFIKAIKLNTGSIDMLLTAKNEYVFLEVNPAGQFGTLSSDCNYYIERKIAQYLALNN